MSKDRAVFIPWTQAERVGFGNGGFTYLTEQPQKRLGLDHTLSKVLEIENGSLAGRVTGAIADADAQAQATHALKHCGLDAGLNHFG
ncbi:MAG: hypothetical protein EBY28_16700 [Betaproteobacteria bacterium]|nr:hypothetical protein [Betaproteobacteria bacterium]